MTTTLAPEPQATAACCGPDCCADDAVATLEAPAEVSIETPIETAESIKTTVREKYAEIAVSGDSCCGTGSGCGCGDIDMIGDAYADTEGYVADADLKLGCGVPTEYANIHEGQTVLDLGSGAGLDAFVVRQIVGETGRVFGVDMTPEMIGRARENTKKLGFDNVFFVEGDIENLPLPDNSVDVVISNCVLNLVPDKEQAFAEVFRVLRPGGHFCISDVVSRGEIPASVRQSVELYVGCVGGALDYDVYLGTVRSAGFAQIETAQARVIDIPDAAVEAVLSPTDRLAFADSDATLMSVTVIGHKP